MKYVARVPIEYILEAVGGLCGPLEIKLTRMGDHTLVEGSIFSLISFFTALANHYHLSLHDIREKFA